MTDESIEVLLAKALRVAPSQVAWLLGQAARAAGTVATADAFGKALLGRLEAMRLAAKDGPLRAIGPDDASVDARLDAIEAGKDDPGPGFKPPAREED